MAEEKTTFTSFLGTGWGFPPTFSRGIDTVEMISDANDIHSSIEILLSTTIGERVMQPEYGCNLEDLLFEPLNRSVRTFFKRMIEKAILLFEPRIQLDDVGFEVDQLNGTIYINLNYVIISTNTRYNIVYPFYLQEGSNLEQ